MNMLFGLKIQVTLGKTMLIAVAVSVNLATLVANDKLCTHTLISSLWHVVK